MKNAITLLFSIFLLTDYQTQAQQSDSLANMALVLPEVEIIYKQESLPATGEKLGEIKFAKGRNTPCDIHDLLSLAKKQAVEKGANAIYVTSIKPTANGRGCFAIAADLYKLQEPYVSTPNPDFPGNVAVTNNNDVYTYTESVPEFPGGESQMLAFITRNFNYPVTALRDRVEGKVIVSYVVQNDGKIGNVQVKQGVRWDLDQEIVRIITSMPEWVPGYQNGKAVHVAYNVPINLSLPQRKKKAAKD